MVPHAIARIVLRPIARANACGKRFDCFARSAKLPIRKCAMLRRTRRHGGFCQRLLIRQQYGGGKVGEMAARCVDGRLRNDPCATVELFCKLHDAGVHRFPILPAKPPHLAARTDGQRALHRPTLCGVRLLQRAVEHSPQPRNQHADALQFLRRLLLHP